jgi:hypothetical protein
MEFTVFLSLSLYSSGTPTHNMKDLIQGDHAGIASRTLENGPMGCPEIDTFGWWFPIEKSVDQP